MQNRIYIILLMCLTVGSCKKKVVLTSSSASAFQFVVPALSKGINLSNWFNDYSSATAYSTRFTAAAMQQIKALGFTYVRIPIGSSVLYNAANPSQLNNTQLLQVDAGVKRAIDAGLGVTINLHPSQNNLDSLLGRSVNGFKSRGLLESHGCLF